METHLSVGVTGSSFSTSFPPLAKMKCERVVPGLSLAAPRAPMRMRSGSLNSGNGSSFYAHASHHYPRIAHQTRNVP